jgi:hypothetical protein
MAAFAASSDIDYPPLQATTHDLPLDSKGAAGTLPVPDSHGSISK